VVLAGAGAGGVFTYLRHEGKSIEEAFPFLSQNEEELSDGEKLNREIRDYNNISINSYKDIDSFEERYEALSEEEKAKVSHYGDISNMRIRYREAFTSEFDSAVASAGSEITLEEYDRLLYFRDYYKQLTKEEKAQIKNYSLLKQAIKRTSEAKRLEVVGRLKELSKDEKKNKKEIASLISRYCKLLNDEDIEQYLVYAVRKNALKNAEERTKDYIKKPKSYKRTKYEIRDYAFKVPDGTYEIEVSIDYTYENNYGSNAKNNRIVYCYYKVNKKGVKFTHAELSKNDIWRIVHRGA
jgi:hypothetical protein